jgi:hypothetical protein
MLHVKCSSGPELGFDWSMDKPILLDSAGFDEEYIMNLAEYKELLAYVSWNWDINNVPHDGNYEDLAMDMLRQFMLEYSNNKDL